MFSNSFLKCVAQETKKFVRYKNPPHHWAEIRKKKHPVDKALNHFDDFYKQVYTTRWESIRKALLGTQKYVAVVNLYGDDKETMNDLELTGALNMRRLCQLEKEYLREELHERKKKDVLEEILELDREIESRVNPDVVESSEEKTQVAHKFSLASSLDAAEIDKQRVVDASDSLSAEILHQFIPATKLKGREDFILESTHYQMYDSTSRFGVTVQKEYDFHFPDNLNIYCYERGNDSDFPSPKRSSTGVYNYYLMDGGSVMPVLALDLKPGCRMLDMCSGPGGKSLLALQTLYPDHLVSNDVSMSRLNRVNRVYDQFLYDFKEKWVDTGKVRLSLRDGRYILDEQYDRILVDVPCTTDRHSLHENDNNIFKPSRTKERLQMPEMQRDLLVNALKLVRVGGIVVYSTCSLSPIQNDGVVNMALKKIWEETNIKIVVKDMSTALMQARKVFLFAEKNFFKYGHMVLPSPKQNYGPTYFCKLQRVA